MCAKKTFWQYFQIHKINKTFLKSQSSHFTFKIYVYYIIGWCFNMMQITTLNNSPFVFAYFLSWE